MINGYYVLSTEVQITGGQWALSKANTIKSVAIYCGL